MSITLGRLRVYVLALVAGALVLAFAWNRFGVGRSESFAAQAKAICRQELNAIHYAPDFQTALAHSHQLEARLSALTPPPAQQALVSDWIAELRATDDGALRGDAASMQASDAIVAADATELGLADGCVHQ